MSKRAYRNIKRGYRYQLIDRPIAETLWVVLDTEYGNELHPIVASELSRAAARQRARELNANDRRGIDRATA